MGAGARTMFEIAYHGMAFEHGAAPNAETYPLIALAIWFILMMVADIVLLRKKELPYRGVLIAIVSLAVFIPVIYMFTHN
jgi:amino acid permease